VSESRRAGGCQTEVVVDDDRQVYEEAVRQVRDEQMGPRPVRPVTPGLVRVVVCGFSAVWFGLVGLLGGPNRFVGAGMLVVGVVVLWAVPRWLKFPLVRGRGKWHVRPQGRIGDGQVERHGEHFRSTDQPLEAVVRLWVPVASLAIAACLGGYLGWRLDSGIGVPIWGLVTLGAFLIGELGWPFVRWIRRSRPTSEGSE